MVSSLTDITVKMLNKTSFSKSFLSFRFLKTLTFYVYEDIFVHSLNGIQHSVTHLADKVIEISFPSIFSAFWIFSMTGLLTWLKNQIKYQRNKTSSVKTRQKHLHYCRHVRKTMLIWHTVPGHFDVKV